MEKEIKCHSSCYFYLPSSFPTIGRQEKGQHLGDSLGTTFKAFWSLLMNSWIHLGRGFREFIKSSLIEQTNSKSTF